MEESYPTWGDGLPMVDPRPRAIAAMRRACTLERDETLGPFPPVFGTAGAVELSETAIMAGCRPQDMPVVEAGLRAALDPAFNLLALQTTTEPPTTMFVVNGSVRDELGFNSGSGVFGPGHRANAVIGRALRLSLARFGGVLSGVTNMSTHGAPGRYGCCIAEDEDATPWDPLHVERGFDADASVVTAIGADSPINTMYNDASPHDLLLVIAQTMAQPATNNSLFAGEVVVVLSPQHARLLGDHGYTKRDAQEMLHHRAVLQLDRLPDPAAGRIVRFREQNGLPLAADGTVAVTSSPSDVIVVVSGGQGAHTAVLPTFGMTRAASCVIARPAVRR